MGALEKFDTADIAPDARISFWNELVGRVYDGTFVNVAANDFTAEMWRWTVGDLKMIRPRAAPSTVGRLANHASGEQRIVLHLQCRGTSLHEQSGRTAVLESGDFALSCANEAYRIDLPKAHELLVVEFPRAALEARLPDLNARLLERISGSTSSARVFYDFLLSLWRQGDQSLTDADWQRGVSDVFYDLVALALRGAKTSHHANASFTVAERAIALVNAQLGEPELRAATIADELHVSARTIQHIFAGMGTTPGAFILERRLACAAERLTAEPRINITELAFDLGFNDSAYFARCFRQRFGTAPSTWRAVERLAL